MSKSKLSSTEIETIKCELRKWMPKGSTVYTILRSRSASGMSRVISPVAIHWTNRVHDNGNPPVDNVDLIFPEYKVAQLLGYTLDKNQGIKVSGCGMDMGWHLVSSLATALYDDYRALGHRWL